MEWIPDRLLPGYECHTFEVPSAVTAPGEPDDPLTGTIVRRNPPTSRRAVMYLHGWNDYFFQTHLADFFAGLGFDFYAVELRRYGRNLREGLLGGYITDLDEYSQELDVAYEIIASAHDQVTLVGHSTGGLVGALWADGRAGDLAGVVLNSPWLDLQGTPLLRAVTAPIISKLSESYPTTAIPLPDNGFYQRTIRAGEEGEWEFDLTLKRSPSFVIRMGWLKAVLQGHARIASGLEIDCPVLVLASARSDFRRRWNESLMSADTVLDVEKIAQAAVRLGHHVTVVRIEDGIHDLVLSRAEVRQVVFDEMERWLGAYVLRGTISHAGDGHAIVSKLPKGSDPGFPA